MIKKYYYEEDNFKLIQGDSLKVLRNIEPNSVDMVFADPPYFLSNNGISCSNGKMVSVNKGPWDKAKTAVGDYVKYGDFTGIITSFGLKSTKIKDFNGNVLNIANRYIDKIINISQERHVIYLRVPTAYEASEEKVKKVLLSVLEKLGKLADVDGKECNYLGIDDLGDSAVKYLITIKCKQGSEYRVRRAALTLIKEAYDKNNIKIPYNQIEVHNGSKI